MTLKEKILDQFRSVKQWLITYWPKRIPVFGLFLIPVAAAIYLAVAIPTVTIIHAVQQFVSFGKFLFTSVRNKFKNLFSSFFESKPTDFRSSKTQKPNVDKPDTNVHSSKDKPSEDKPSEVVAPEEKTTPRSISPGSMSSESVTPELGSPRSSTPELETPELETPELETPEVTTQESTTEELSQQATVENVLASGLQMVVYNPNRLSFANKEEKLELPIKTFIMDAIRNMAPVSSMAPAGNPQLLFSLYREPSLFGTMQPIVLYASAQEAINSNHDSEEAGFIKTLEFPQSHIINTDEWENIFPEKELKDELFFKENVEILAHALPYKLYLLLHEDHSIILKLKIGIHNEYYKCICAKKNKKYNTGLMPFILTPLNEKDLSGFLAEPVKVYSPEPNDKGKYTLSDSLMELEALKYEIKKNSHNRVHVLFRGTADLDGLRRDVVESDAGNDTLFNDAENILDMLIDNMADIISVDLSVSGHSLGGADAQNFFTYLLNHMSIESNSGPKNNTLFEKIKSITVNHANSASVTPNTLKICSTSAEKLRKLNMQINMNVLYCDGDVVQPLGLNVLSSEHDLTATVEVNGETVKVVAAKFLKTSVVKTNVDHMADILSSKPAAFAVVAIATPLGSAYVAIAIATIAQKARRAFNAHTRFISIGEQRFDFFDNNTPEGASAISKKLNNNSFFIQHVQSIKNSFLVKFYGERFVGSANNIGLKYFNTPQDDAPKVMPLELPGIILNEQKNLEKEEEEVKLRRKPVAS